MRWHHELVFKPSIFCSFLQPQFYLLLQEETFIIPVGKSGCYSNKQSQQIVFPDSSLPPSHPSSLPNTLNPLHTHFFSHIPI